MNLPDNWKIKTLPPTLAAQAAFNVPLSLSNGAHPSLTTDTATVILTRFVGDSSGGLIMSAGWCAETATLYVSEAIKPQHIPDILRVLLKESP